MTKQLALLHLSAPSARPAGDSKPGADARPPAGRSTSRGSGRPIGTQRRGTSSSTTRRSVDHIGWLDQRTIETGRQGLAAARAALADATRRVHARDEERAARRDEELARQADLFRHPANRGSHAA